MTGWVARLERALAAELPPVPLLVGGCGTGRTRACQALCDRLGRGRAQYVDLERAATTPERLLQAIVRDSPFVTATGELPPLPSSPREAYDETLKFLATARPRDGGTATFVLDEVLEFRTFESFPGLREALPELVQAVADSPNRFVLTTRYATRGARLIQEASSRRVEVWPAVPMTVEETLAHLRRTCLDPASPDPGDEELARLVVALGAGRPMYADALAGRMRDGADGGVRDPIAVLAEAIAPGGRLDLECRYRYEMRLQRARGYGALRAILAVLAEDEPLTLTPIARQMRRTAGSTKDYLTWLCDVDLVAVDRKRYRFVDPVLRLWVRLQARTTAPDADMVAAEVSRYALERLALVEEAAEAVRATAPVAPPAAAGVTAARDARAWKDMEID